MLTDRQCKTAKPRAKSWKLYDTAGLYLLVKPNGSKLWQLKYTFDEKAKTYSIGQYGEQPHCVGLAAARERRDEAKALLKQDRDPTLAKRLKREHGIRSHATTLQSACEQWLAKQEKRWSRKHAGNVCSAFRVEVYPILGNFPVAAVTGPMILKRVLEPMDRRGAHEAARRLRQKISSVYRLAAANDLVPQGYDPAGQHLIAGLAPIPPTRHQPALTDMGELREMLRKAEDCPGAATTKLATRFIALTSVRVATMMSANWEQFAGLDGGRELPVWDIPAANMKGETGRKVPFMVPLCAQAVDVLMAARILAGGFKYVFPSDIKPDEKPISNNAVVYHLYRAGYRGHHTAHGFRASFSTIMNERHPLQKHVIDFALGHVQKNEVEAAYNRAKYMAARRALHQEYADELLDGFPPASVLLESRRR